MMTQTDTTFVHILEQLIADGPQEVARIVTTLVNAGVIVQRLSGKKVQHGRKQKGPRYRGPFCLSLFIPEWSLPVVARPWRGVTGAWSERA